MAQGSDATEAKITFWHGFGFDAYTPFGLLVLFFATGYMGVTAEEAKAAAAYLHARPVAERGKGGPVYVTGQLSAPDLGSDFVKPGRYLRIVQRSEVYAFERRNNPRGATVYGPGWTSSPENPATFADPHYRAEVFHRKTIDPAPVSADLKVIDDGKEYRIDPAEVDLPADMSLVPPAGEALAKPEWGVKEMQGSETLVLYTSKACQDEPVGGCERVMLSVLPRPDGPMTFVGDLRDGQVVKHGEMLKGARGDFKALLDAFGLSHTLDRAGAFILRFVCLLGMWLALWMAYRPLRRLLGGISFLRGGQRVQISLVLAGVLAAPAYLLRGYALVMALALVLSLLVACREPRTA